MNFGWVFTGKDWECFHAVANVGVIVGLGARKYTSTPTKATASTITVISNALFIFVFLDIASYLWLD